MSPPRTPAAALAAGYVEQESYEVSEVVAFVRAEAAAPTLWLRGHQISVIATIGVGLVLGWRDVSAGADLFGKVVTPFGAGVVATLALVIPHELLHAAAFHRAGAPSVAFGADWRRLVFHASAPGFAVNYRRMVTVALAPFALLTPSLLAALFALDGWARWLTYGVLLAHTQGCLGDAAVLNAFARRERPGDWLTYDDAREPRFVFLRKRTAVNEKGAAQP